MHLVRITSGPQWMPLRNEPTRGIDDVLAAVGVVAAVNHFSGLA